MMIISESTLREDAYDLLTGLDLGSIYVPKLVAL